MSEDRGFDRTVFGKTHSLVFAPFITEVVANVINGFYSQMRVNPKRCITLPPQVSYEMLVDCLLEQKHTWPALVKLATAGRVKDIVLSPFWTQVLREKHHLSESEVKGMSQINRVQRVFALWRGYPDAIEQELFMDRVLSTEVSNIINAHIACGLFNTIYKLLEETTDDTMDLDHTMDAAVHSDRMYPVLSPEKGLQSVGRSLTDTSSIPSDPRISRRHTRLPVAEAISQSESPLKTSTMEQMTQMDKARRSARMPMDSTVVRAESGSVYSPKHSSRMVHSPFRSDSRFEEGDTAFVESESSVLAADRSAHGVVFFQTEWYSEAQMRAIERKYKSFMDRAPLVVFGDNDLDKYRSKKREPRQHFGGQAAAVGAFDTQFGFGVTTTFFNPSAFAAADDEFSAVPPLEYFQSLIETEFAQIRTHLLRGFDVIIPMPNDGDLSGARRRRYFDERGREQVIHHNLGTGIANLPPTHLLAIERCVADLCSIARNQMVVSKYDCNSLTGDGTVDTGSAQIRRRKRRRTVSPPFAAAVGGWQRGAASLRRTEAASKRTAAVTFTRNDLLGSPQRVDAPTDAGLLHTMFPPMSEATDVSFAAKSPPRHSSPRTKTGAFSTANAWSETHPPVFSPTKRVRKRRKGALQMPQFVADSSFPLSNAAVLGAVVCMYLGLSMVYENNMNFDNRSILCMCVGILFVFGGVLTSLS